MCSSDLGGVNASALGSGGNAGNGGLAYGGYLRSQEDALTTDASPADSSEPQVS